MYWSIPPIPSQCLYLSAVELWYDSFRLRPHIHAYFGKHSFFYALWSFAHMTTCRWDWNLTYLDFSLEGCAVLWHPSIQTFNQWKTVHWSECNGFKHSSFSFQRFDAYPGYKRCKKIKIKNARLDNGCIKKKEN